MSPLTKSFVVVVTVLSILLVAVVVPFVAKTQDYRDLLQAAINDKEAARQRTRNLQAEISLLQSRESERVIGLNDEVAALLAENSELRGEKARLRDKMTGLDAEITNRDANFSSLTASTQQQTRLLEEFTHELTTSRNKLVQQQTRVIELVDRNNELAAQIAGYGRQIRQLRENSTRMRDRTHQLERAIAKLEPGVRQMILEEEASGSTSRIVPLVPIIGSIVYARPSDEFTLVEVDIGSGDGVEENMEFLVHRGDTFLGTLVIIKVDTDAAAGRMELIQADVTPGDSVFAGRL